jgi:hypothetical protein
MKAAELDTSVSALVRWYLTELGAGEPETERLKLPAGFRAADRLTRDEVHERDA